jgi:hypothetical protein
MAEISPSVTIGCLLDVSGSMHEALETEHSNEGTTERLRAALGAALQLARVEQGRDPHALMFVGVFGLNTEARCPAVVDLYDAISALLDLRGDDERSGRDLLIALANENNLSHIIEYIQTKLTDDEARIVHLHLQRNPDRVSEFVQAIPSPHELRTKRAATKGFGTAGTAILVGTLGSVVLGPVSALAGAALGGCGGYSGASMVEDHAVEKSDAMQLAHRIWDEWWHELTALRPRPVSDVVDLLQRLQEQQADNSQDGETSDSDTQLDMLRRYMYGTTPMRQALTKTLEAFRERPDDEQRVLLLVSDGKSTDGNPLALAEELRREKVVIASVYLTRDTAASRRRFYDKAATGWHPGQHTLYRMASRVSSSLHPIPVLLSMGWRIPSSGECALYVTVCTVEALDEFCSLLMSARFGSADALLDVVGRVRLDAYINDEHFRLFRTPSDQNSESTCYAHATAAVIHMALLRIVGREGGYPSIEDIRSRILETFPPGPDGRAVEDVLQAAMTWYRPLRYREVNEDGARQAVLRRRPVLTTFRLSYTGWEAFGIHFQDEVTATSVLTRRHMSPYRSWPDGGGHAVVLVRCDPTSLTFLNSWGSDWGNHGSFSVEDHTVLQLDGTYRASPVRFYDVYWLEDDLTASERHQYDVRVDEALQARAEQYPSLLQLESQCPLCRVSSPIVRYTGSIRAAVCPSCGQSFQPQPGHLVQALYARAGLSVVPED